MRNLKDIKSIIIEFKNNEKLVINKESLISILIPRSKSVFIEISLEKDDISKNIRSYFEVTGLKMGVEAHKRSITETIKRGDISVIYINYNFNYTEIIPVHWDGNDELYNPAQIAKIEYSKNGDEILVIIIKKPGLY